MLLQKFNATGSGAPLFLYDASEGNFSWKKPSSSFGYHKDAFVRFKGSEHEEREDISNNIKWKFCTKCNSGCITSPKKLPGVLVFTVPFSVQRLRLIKEGQAISRGDLAGSNIF
ncbi:MAG: hypothetical protein Ct9H90mP27_3970 [Gammaproteobacteria bacterium]|nr:MAG: hypothetical protein Ct9H90mP27_3970 [Gammaproteobacteria bacterium]